MRNKNDKLIKELPKELDRIMDYSSPQFVISAHKKKKKNPNSNIKEFSYWWYACWFAIAVQETWTEGANWYSFNKLGGKN